MSAKTPSKRIVGATFGPSTAFDEDGNKAIRGLHLRGCTFERCRLRAAFFSKGARRVSDVTIEAARAKQVSAQRLDLRNVVVDGCDCDQAVRLENVRFDRVVMRGNVGRWHVSSELSTPELVAETRAFYDKVDWALDIREARFTDAIFRGIPVEKIRRDPTRHFVLRKDKLRADDGWRKLSKSIQNRVPFWLGLRSSTSERTDTELLVANDHAPTFELELERYRALRDAGYSD